MATLDILVANELYKRAISEIITESGLQPYHLHIIFDHEDKDIYIKKFKRTAMGHQLK